MSSYICRRCGALGCYDGLSGTPKGCYAEDAEVRHRVATAPADPAVAPPFTRGKVHLYADFNAISETGRVVGSFGSHSTNLGDGGHAENAANAARFEAVWNAFADVRYPLAVLAFVREILNAVDGELATVAQNAWAVQQRSRLRLVLDVLKESK